MKVGRLMALNWLRLAASEDGRAAGEKCSLLLADFGGEPSDTAVWEHREADCRLASGGGLVRALPAEARSGENPRRWVTDKTVQKGTSCWFADWRKRRSAFVQTGPEFPK